MSYALQQLEERYKPVIGGEPNAVERARTEEIVNKFAHWYTNDVGLQRLTVPKAIYDAFRPLFGKDLVLPFSIDPDNKEHRLRAFMFELAGAVKAASTRLAMRETKQGRIADEELELALATEVKLVYPAMLTAAHVMRRTLVESIGARSTAHGLQ